MPTAALRRPRPMHRAKATRDLTAPSTGSVRLVRPLERHADVLGLLLRELRELHTELVEVQRRHLLVEVLRAARRPSSRSSPVFVAQLDLREHLVGEASSTSRTTGGRWRSRGSAAGPRRARSRCGRPGRRHSSYCGLMLIRSMPATFFRPAMSISLSKWPMLPTIALSFICAMCSTVMMSWLPVAVMKMSALLDHVLERRHLVALHRRLQRADRVDLGDDHARALAAERLRRSPCRRRRSRRPRATLPPIITSVARLMPSIERVAAAVEVVELRLGDRVVDVDRREQQRARLRASRRAGGRRWWSPR